MIGGEHYFTPSARAEHSLGEILEGKIGEIAFFSTGRDALYSLLASLPHQSIYLPDLVCASNHQACVAAGKAVITYPVGEDLLDCGQLDLQKAAPACLLALHYFGVTNAPLLIRARQAGLTVISDVTHMLFNPGQLELIAMDSNYLIASLRKSGAFPDGGFVSSCKEPLIQATLPIRAEFFSLRAAGLLSRGFSAHDDFCDDENFNLLKKAEDVIDRSSPGPHQCSYLSRRLLFTVNVGAAAMKICGNMQTLATKLKASAPLLVNPAWHRRIFAAFSAIVKSGILCAPNWQRTNIFALCIGILPNCPRLAPYPNDASASPATHGTIKTPCWPLPT